VLVFCVVGRQRNGGERAVAGDKIPSARLSARRKPIRPPEHEQRHGQTERPHAGGWPGEIYRAGNAHPIKQSSIYFDTIVSAKRAGKVALTELLNKLFA
jgi:hypothetical protein